VSPSPPIPQIPQSLKTDEVDSRLDAWRAVETQLNDVDRLLSDGDSLVNSWQNGNEDAVRGISNTFANSSGNQRNRLKQLLGTYNSFTDLSVVDPNTLDRLAMFAFNLSSELGQLPADVAKDEYLNSTKPFIGAIKREMASLKQWTQTTRKVAESSILELTARQQSLK
jgi:hypothetical protein